ncbi:TonB-dependent receptor [Zhongshania aquimaris]|uniref:TonB-dependent receptor n=1 Tax=Zhongshania aquimaris TaxID=2857107 RepID=A0ABS6VSN6_9GAMM|nr:TonB-dependent receptor [Zhongshania aquimaris]MBW2941337.1 TonB-dependent receptor [Zhongshania aquimaris]
MKTSLPLVIAAISCLPTWVIAQAAKDTDNVRKNRLIEEIVVTAQKREQDSQDVPIAIQAFSGDKLDAFNIEDTADLQRITPGVTFTYTYGYTLIYIRGVGSDAFLPNADPSVATYIDGINIPASQGKQDTLGPVERVEVLKGPQGTLFGRNATAGAISIITKDPPVDEIVGSIKYVAGNYDAQQFQAYLGLPIIDGLGITFAGFKDSQENYGDNFSNGNYFPIREDFSEGGRIKIKWDSDIFSATLIGSYINQFNGNSLVQENTRPSLILGAGAEVDEADRNTDTNFKGGNGTINTMAGATLEWRPGPVDLKFTYGDQLAKVDFGQFDYDSTDEDRAGFFTYDQYNEQKTYELQLLSNQYTPGADKFEWVAGYYRLEAEGGFGRLFFFLNNGFATGLLPEELGDILAGTPKVTLESGGLLYTESDAIYFQGTYNFSSEWGLTFGARYQEETREIGNANLYLVDTLTPGISQAYYEGNDYSRNILISEFDAPPLEEETFSPKIALQWFPNEATQVYASLQRGYKSPTYNIVNFFGNPNAVEGEEATAAELGFKSEWLDKTLTFNAAIFASKTKDLLTGIVSFTSGATVRYSNAGTAEAKGIEFDFQWQPMPEFNPGLAVTGGATYINSEFSDYKNGEGFDDTTGLYFGPGGLEDIPLALLGIELPLPIGDIVNGPRDFTGNRVPRTPKFSSSVSVNQYVNIGDASAIEIAVDYSYKSEYFTTPQNSPFYVQDQYEIWSARASYFYNPWGLQLTAFVDNAKDKDYFSSILQQDFGRTVTLAPPRLYGLKIKWDFDIDQ